MANANQDLNQHRREDQRTDLNTEFRGLCSAAPDDDSQLLYGADITERFKTISDTNPITENLAPVTSAGSGARQDTATCMQWTKLTSDKCILRSVADLPGFDHLPPQRSLPLPLTFSASEAGIVDEQIQNFLLTVTNRFRLLPSRWCRRFSP